MGASAADMIIGAGGPVENVSGTTAKTGVDYYAVQCLTACTFTTFTERNATGSITGVAIPAGTVILNPAGITAVTASSGNLWRAVGRA